MREPAKTAVERFWEKVDKGPHESGCWLWKVCCFRHGYGQFDPGNGRSKYAHRFSYEIHFGPVPLGLYVLHKTHCPNRHCVNPDHLYAGTAKQNTADMYVTGSISRMINPLLNWKKDNPAAFIGEKHPMAKLNEKMVREILALRGHITWPEISDQYGITIRNVALIMARKSWTHLSDIPEPQNRKKQSCGEKHQWAKLTQQQVLQIRSLHKKIPIRNIAEIVGIPIKNVRNIIYRVSWKHI